MDWKCLEFVSRCEIIISKISVQITVLAVMYSFLLIEESVARVHKITLVLLTEGPKCEFQ